MTRADEIKKEADDFIVWLGENLALVKALKAGTWRAIPAKPTEEMLNRGVDWILQGHMTETYQDDLKEAYTAILTAAPAKPEE